MSLRTEKLIMSRTIIKCNTTMQVMGRITEQEAVIGIIKGDLTSLKDSGRVYRSQKLNIAVPEIVMLNDYVNESWKYDDPERTLRGEYHSKAIILNRDKHECCYCGGYGNTVDHIIPKDLGGESTWDNLVACCESCNSEKTNIPLAVIGWKMRFEPTRPKVKHVPKRETNDQEIVDKFLTELTA